MNWVTGGDEEYAGFLQRLAGYSLTGSTQEHSLCFVYGTGGNGKGTWLNTVSGILGEYAAVAPIETFTEQRGERHPTELAKPLLEKLSHVWR
jgi:putative DNA primase/helicase